MTTFASIAGGIALVLCCVLAVAMTAFRLPGTWLMVAVGVVYPWLLDWKPFGWGVPAILAGAALVGEVVELLMSAVLARKAGASRHAQWGGLIGGILGMILLSFLVPIPVVGTIAGAFVGCCLGAALAELYVRRSLGQGAKVGVFSGIGFALGTAAKTTIAMMMAGLLLVMAFRGA